MGAINKKEGRQASQGGTHCIPQAQPSWNVTPGPPVGPRARPALPGPPLFASSMRLLVSSGPGGFCSLCNTIISIRAYDTHTHKLAKAVGHARGDTGARWASIRVQQQPLHYACAFRVPNIRAITRKSHLDVSINHIVQCFVVYSSNYAFLNEYEADPKLAKENIVTR